MKRVASIDIFRALTMLLMIFVNDIPGLGETIPHWFHHAEANEDMLGLSDVVFPSFLFCLGLSIPYAIQNRRAKGCDTSQILSHIFTRTIALLVMGLFSMNGFGETAKIVGISASWLKIISVAAFFMIWNVYPHAEGAKKNVFKTLQACGWLILTLLAFVYVRNPSQTDVSVKIGLFSIGFEPNWRYLFHYSVIAFCALFSIFVAFKHKKNVVKLILEIIIFIVLFYLFLLKGKNADNMVGLRPGWWQILGLIGWTYLYTAVIFVFTNNSIKANIVAWVAFTLLCIAANAGLVGVCHNFIPGNGTFQSFAFAGVLASLVMQKNYGYQNFKRLGSIFISASVFMLILGVVAHRFYIISKLQETCTWVFFCLAISFAALLFIHWLADVKNKACWFNAIKPAGTSTLTCYVLPSVWYAAVTLLGVSYPLFMRTGIGGLIKSMVFAFVIIGITWLLGKVGIKLKI